MKGAATRAITCKKHPHARKAHMVETSTLHTEILKFARPQHLVSDLPQEGEGHLAQCVRVANGREDDFLASTLALHRRQVDRAADLTNTKVRQNI